MKVPCYECGYHTLRYLPMTDEFRCPECNWRVTGQTYESMHETKNSGMGIFQIHESPLVPPGQVYLFSQELINLVPADYANKIQKILQDDMAKMIDKYIASGFQPKEKPFDYKERASIEFDLDNNSGLR